jgi:hypothetical protein
MVGQPAEQQEEPDPQGDGSRTHWEFYLGGMVGLTLAFTLWAMGLKGASAGENVVEGAVAAGLRSIFWFVAYGVLETIIWPASSRVVALTAGVAALLLNLTVSGGIAVPSVAQPLWVVAALALNALPSRLPAWALRSNFAFMLPLPLALAVCIAYVLSAFYPAYNCSAWMREASDSYAVYRERRALAGEEKNDATKRRELVKAGLFLDDSVIKKRLVNAVNADPNDADARLELSYRLGELWELTIITEPPEPDPQKKVRNMTKLRNTAEDLARDVIRLDPQSPRGYLALYQYYIRRLVQYPDNEDLQNKLYSAAADAIRQACDRAPANAELHYLRAETLHHLDNRREDMRGAAWKALERDKLAPRRPHRLKDEQRNQLKKWLDET